MKTIRKHEGQFKNLKKLDKQRKSRMKVGKTKICKTCKCPYPNCFCDEAGMDDLQ